MSYNLKNKSILLTGGDGFIGSHLAEELVNKCGKLRVLTQYNSLNSWGWLDNSNLTNSMDIWHGDIRDPGYCRKLVEGIDTIFHLAALIAIPYSYQAPSSYVNTNMMGTTNMLEAAVEKGVESFYQTSTSEVYGSALQVPISEDHPLQPQSPYSASKIASDSIAKSFYYSFDLPVTIVRPFNTYGPRQSARAVIPTIISQVLNGCNQIQLGALSPTRDFNYVTDTCQGFIDIAANGGLPGEAINIGSNREISIGDLTLLILTLMNKEHIEIVCHQERIRPEKSEVNRLLADSTKIQKLCNYKPKMNLKDGLAETIKWFSDSNNLRRYRSGIYNV